MFEKEKGRKHQVAVSLYPRTWSQYVQRSINEYNRGTSSRRMHCEASIVSPLGVVIESVNAAKASTAEMPDGETEDEGEGIGARWDDFACELELVPAEMQQVQEKGLGALVFQKGLRDEPDVWPPLIQGWIGLEPGDFQDLWRRVRSSKSPNVLISVEVEGSLYDAGEFLRRWRWNVKDNSRLRVLTVELTYRSTETANESLDRLRRRGLGHRSIDPVLKEFLKEQLPKAPKGDNSGTRRSQFNDIARQVAHRVAAYSKAQGEDTAQFEERLSDAFEVLTSVRWATNEKTHGNWSSDDEGRSERAEREKAEHTIWYHGNPRFVFQQGYESEYARKVDVGALEEAASKYLVRPWMENEWLEWIIADALTFSAVTRFGEELKEHSPGPVTFLGLNMAYYAAKGNVNKMLWKRIQYGLTKLAVKLGIFFGAPIAVGWYFWNRGYQDEVLIAGLVYGGLLGLYFVYRVLRWIFGKRQKTVVERYAPVLDEMFLTYDLLAADLVSPTLIKERLLDTMRKGAVWSGAAFAILEHAIHRNPSVWRLAEGDLYRG